MLHILENNRWFSLSKIRNVFVNSTLPLAEDNIGYQLLMGPPSLWKIVNISKNTVWYTSRVNSARLSSSCDNSLRQSEQRANRAPFVDTDRFCLLLINIPLCERRSSTLPFVLSREIFARVRYLQISWGFAGMLIPAQYEEH